MRAKVEAVPGVPGCARIRRRDHIHSHDTDRQHTRLFRIAKFCLTKVSLRGECTHLSMHVQRRSFATKPDPGPGHAMAATCFPAGKKSRRPQTIRSGARGHSIRGLAAYIYYIKLSA